MKILSLELEEDPDLGKYYVMRVDADAEEALFFNLKLLEDFEIPILVTWERRENTSKSRIAELLAEVLIKSGIKATLVPGYSAVKAVEEDREDC